MPVLAAHVHTAEWLEFPRFVTTDPSPFGSRIPLRRGVVEARIEARELGEIEVLVAHFKSKHPVPFRDPQGAIVSNGASGNGTANGTEPAPGRSRAEGELRSLVWRSAEALFVRGLVDERHARGARVVVAGDLNDVADSVPLRALQGNDLASCVDLVPAERRFSIVARGKRQAIDHILVSQELRARLVAANFVNQGLHEHPPFDSGEAEPTVDSDHAPLVARFE
jgi:predicted extracellular nuclease